MIWLVVGDRAKIGANSVVIHDVPPNSTVVGNPGHPVRVDGKKPGGPDADWVHLPDPIADAIKGLSARIGAAVFLNLSRCSLTRSPMSPGRKLPRV